MIDLLIAAAVLAFLVWLGRGASASKKASSSGKWRIVGGMIALAVVVWGTLLLVRGAWIGGVPLLITGLGMALAARRRGARSTATESSPSSARMSVAEARSMLGVGEGASRAEIEAAYKRLMIRVHPDHGGASGLAIQLNAARDVLLKS